MKQITELSGKLGELVDFLREVKLRPEVVIVGAGPSARMLVPKNNPNWERIVKGRTVILCNGAPDVAGADVYMAFDGGATEYPWYRAGRAKHYLLGHALAAKKAVADHYTFTYYGTLTDLMGPSMRVRRAPPGMFKPNTGPYRGYLHGGATIVTCALQLAMHYAGTRIIYLIGADQCGGSWCNLKAPNRRFGPLMGKMVARAMRGGFYPGSAPVPVYHIGPSRLPCPRVSPDEMKEAV